MDLFILEFHPAKGREHHHMREGKSGRDGDNNSPLAFGQVFPARIVYLPVPKNRIDRAGCNPSALPPDVFQLFYKVSCMLEQFYCFIH
jgi:hypothetical protein